MELVRPTAQHLVSYTSALKRGWSPDNVRGQARAREELYDIHHHPQAFLTSMDDAAGAGPRIVLPDGSTVPRIPGLTRWIWDGEFCGSINLRWQVGTTALPDHVPGHIGYAVVPWKQRRGCASFALASMLAQAAELGLSELEITTDPDNIASQKVISRCGGVLVEEFFKPVQCGGGKSLRFRIVLESHCGVQFMRPAPVPRSIVAA